MHFKNVLSCFDGISCGQLALVRAGHTYDNYYASEVDKYAIKITLKNFPQTIQIGDIKSVWSRNLPQIDLIMGGSPCQDLSIAGKRAGLSGERSGLFWHFVRLVRTCKPKYFLLENVASMTKENRDIISEALGVEPVLINSNCFSAQDRPRFYWTNIPFNKNISECGLCLEDILQKEVDEKYFYSYPLVNINTGKQVCATMLFKNNEIHKRILNPKFKCHTLTTCSGGNTQKKVYINGRARKLTPLEYERLQTLPDNYTDCVAESHRYSVCGNGWTVDVIAHIFSFIKE